MDLTIREAATVLNRPERTVRDQVKRGVIRGFKRNGRWLVKETDLPMDAARRRQRRDQVDRVRGTVERALRKRAKPMTVEDMEVFRIARAVRQRILDHRPRAAAAIEDAMIELSVGQHQFQPPVKLAAFRRARAHLARAAAVLRLDPDDAGGHLEADTLEVEVMPRLGGIMHAIDGPRHT